jgi:hypothetical protein
VFVEQITIVVLISVILNFFIQEESVEHLKELHHLMTLLTGQKKQEYLAQLNLPER